MAKILIVDDKASMRKMLKEALEGQGHQCRAASSGSEALMLLKKDACDLLLTDLRMPNGSGKNHSCQRKSPRTQRPVPRVSKTRTRIASQTSQLNRVRPSMKNSFHSIG